ncbi:hypothetical protein CRU96_05660 [Malaciobacter halophilus]|nr:hypothetical protein [Malaciobacter halophilus]RYA23893.1 hypothetical protein CRU96_05660 [Malaciobacter halophilus]
MKVIKVKQEKQGYKVTTENNKEHSIPYVKGTFLYKETKAFIDGGEVVEDEFSLEDIKKQKLNSINNSCNQTIISGFKSKALGSWHFYYSTLEEQSTLNSLITLGVNNNFKAQKISIVDEKEVKEERIKYEHTIEQLREVLKDGATHIAEQIEKKDLLEAQINVATTVEELDGIVW